MNNELQNEFDKKVSLFKILLELMNCLTNFQKRLHAKEKKDTAGFSVVSSVLNIASILLF